MKTMPVNNPVARTLARPHHGFTLIELLVVISVIAVLAGLTLGVVGGVSKTKSINNAKSEMAAIQTAIERYHAAYGVYPPSGPGNSLVNPLFFELEGTTMVVANGVTNYTTLDGAQTVALSDIYPRFGVRGFVNCSRGNGEELVPAKTFLPNLKVNQIGTTGSPAVAILTSSVGGPDQAYQPLLVTGMNPWRYNSANPTNNPGTYDLYIQLVIGGKTNLISNWSKQVQLNNSSYP